MAQPALKFQRAADLEIGDTAGSETCATRAVPGYVHLIGDDREKRTTRSGRHRRGFPNVGFARRDWPSISPGCRPPARPPTAARQTNWRRPGPGRESIPPAQKFLARGNPPASLPPPPDVAPECDRKIPANL